ncbi:MAG: HAD family hydrolase [Nitrospinae bacterium]|nr:HAD family hydrolase [Nitrospinota bacterium]
MPAVKGIGFDVFGTLVLQEGYSLEQSVETLVDSLLASGLHLEKDPFVQAYRDVNRRLFAQSVQDGRETHNRFWVAGALQALGHAVDASDPRIDGAVDAYFAPFIESCRLIPGTGEMLETLVGTHRLGLVSNFTHPPALYRILERLNLRRFFQVILISGSLGIRKPHPMIFGELSDRMGLPPEEIMYVGDELRSDIVGAHSAGMRTVWMTYRQVLERSSPLEHFLGLSQTAREVRPDYVIKAWSEFPPLLA